MKLEHKGSLEDLQVIIKGCGFNIDDVSKQEHNYQIRTNEGAIVNWYQGSCKIVIQGKKEPKEKMTTAWGEYAGSNQVANDKTQASGLINAPSVLNNNTTANKKVFLVHGHDTNSKEQLELVIHKLGLNPFVLANTGGHGLTIIEALEKEIGTQEGMARFGIVLLTPDDMGYAKSDGTNKVEPRARQNVVLEMGMLISALGRNNVAILKKGHLEVPSDAQGILYIPYNDHVKEAVPKLADRLRNAGFVLNPEAITNASS